MTFQEDYKIISKLLFNYGQLVQTALSDIKLNSEFHQKSFSYIKGFFLLLENPNTTAIELNDYVTANAVSHTKKLSLSPLLRKIISDIFIYFIVSRDSFSIKDISPYLEIIGFLIEESFGDRTEEFSTSNYHIFGVCHNDGTPNQED